MYYWLRIISLLFFDAIFINASIYISLWLRFEGVIPANYLASFYKVSPWFTLIILVCLYCFRLYHRMWQYASVGELYGIVKAITTGVGITIILIYTVPLYTLPRSVYILSWVFMIAIIGGSRLSWRMIRENIMREAGVRSRRTLIVGAGDAGAMVTRELLNNASLGLLPIGFIDDSMAKQKLTLYGIPVLGSREDIPRLVKNYEIDEIIISMPSAGGKTIREIIDICHNAGIEGKIFQGADKLLNGPVRIRKVELEDLLRREPVKLDMDEISGYISGCKIMISGAGGSIGSELCRQLGGCSPATLILVDNTENNLFDIENELCELYPQLTIQAELCDVKDRLKLQEVFRQHYPDVVFHAAAYKHVPMMEKHPEEAIKNNILGTRNMAELADKYKTGVFILISTDKAVNPSSVMGATKRIAEMIIQDINKNSSTRFAAVRFGNVLGSRGSVIPTFKRQIEKGGPVTITHPDMTRYFMTIPEAVELVIQAGGITNGGEIFVLDMGEPVKIMDLAQDLIKLYGYMPDKDIQIQITGIRPGEKLYEELFTAREQMAATRHERIFMSRREQDRYCENIHKTVDKLLAQNVFLNHHDAVDLIMQILPEYEGQNAREATIITS